MLALAASGTSACTTASGVIDTSCTLFGPITYSSKDTEQTQSEIRKHNSVWVCRCEKDCPK